MVGVNPYYKITPTINIQATDRIGLLAKDTVVNATLVSMNNGQAKLILENTMVNAKISSDQQLLTNVPMEFIVVENKGNVIKLKPYSDNPEEMISSEDDMADDMSARIAHALGVDASPENIAFIKNQAYLISRNVLKLAALLKNTEGFDNDTFLQKLGATFITASELAEYLKSFDKDNLTNIVSRLNTLIREMKSVVNPKILNQISSDFIKAITIQLNVNFPFYFIPLIIIKDQQMQSSELWIKKDEHIIFLWLDTDNLGALKIRLQYDDDITIDFEGKKDSIEILEENKKLLSQALQNKKIKIKSIVFEAVDNIEDPLTIISKYITINKPIDIEI